MSKRLTKALLRLCDLEKKALETEVDFWKQEVILGNQAFKEIEETNLQLQDGLRELETLRSQNTAMRDQVAKARLERDQARVELKALAEENERLRKRTAGWVHISRVSAQGCPREVLGLGSDASVRLLRFDGLHRFSAFSGSGQWKLVSEPYYVMEIPPINYDEEPAVRDV